LVFIFTAIIEVFVLTFGAVFYLCLANQLNRFLASIDRPMLANIRTELVN
jgi:hypothetical protein